MNVRRILVGLDGSSREELVLAAAQDLALRFDAHLILFRAVGLPPEIPPEAWQHADLTVEQFLESRAKDALSKSAATLCAALASKHSLEVLFATPWQGVCSIAQSHDVDLIVIGSHGYGGIDRVLGTTAARVVNHAQCSVLVIRPPEPRAAHGNPVER
jgi:nucleotide-binding universal stress UspA family protein